MIVVSADTEDDLLEFRGLVESKIRHLVTSLDRNQNISLVHVNPETLPTPPDSPPYVHLPSLHESPAKLPYVHHHRTAVPSNCCMTAV